MCRTCETEAAVAAVLHGFPCGLSEEALKDEKFAGILGIVPAVLSCCCLLPESTSEYEPLISRNLKEVSESLEQLRSTSDSVNARLKAIESRMPAPPAEEEHSEE